MYNGLIDLSAIMVLIRQWKDARPGQPKSLIYIA